MIKKTKSLFAVVLLALVGLSFSGCGDTIEEYYEDGAMVKSYYFDVVENPNASNTWIWNNDIGRWECTFNFNDVTQYIYETGVIHASVFVYENGKDESMKSLPYVRTYEDLDTGTFFEETISYDIISRNGTPPYKIRFSIQTSNGKDYEDFLQDYQFKVNLIWY